MNILIVGSVAFNRIAPEYATRTPNDLDIVATYDDIVSFVGAIKKSGEGIIMQYPMSSGNKMFIRTTRRIIEAEIAWPDSHSEELLKIAKAEADTFINLYGVHCIVPNMNLLYTLKQSHKYLKDSPHFLKTMRDIQMMEGLGCVIEEKYRKFFDRREKETYNYALPKLNQSKADFFNNENNIYTLSHDSIHEAVKHLDKPAYEYFKPDTAEVMTSKEMFFKCPKEVQLLAAYEEICVLSIERSIHVFPDVDRKWAFDKAHMKLASSISSGWFRKFVYDNYDTVQAMYDVEYVERFYEALKAGKILPFKQEK